MKTTIVDHANPLRLLALFSVLLLLPADCFLQGLEPGFDKAEYRELLKVSTRQGDSLYNPELPAPEYFQRRYRSEEIGLDNRWELWLSKDNVAAISIRGTTMQTDSWLENFYAAMVPAAGEINIAPEFDFNYQLSSHPNAAVHAGWLIGMAYIARDLQPHLDSLVAAGCRDLLIVGHSQGGAIAYLLASHLLSKRSKGALASDMRIKTYCSAAPKPGNLYYAYSFERSTYRGWAFNVVNAADWVPEGPFSIQTTDDFNPSNPFKEFYAMTAELKWPKRAALRRIYKNLDHPPKKASRRFQKYLGDYLDNVVGESLPGYHPPAYFPSSNYCRAGHQIVLLPESDYYERFPDQTGEIWNHHKFEAYFYLLDQLPEADK